MHDVKLRPGRGAARRGEGAAGREVRCGDRPWCDRPARRRLAWCRVAVGREDQEAAIARPARRRLGLVLGVRELTCAGYATLGAHDVNVRLAARLLPVRNAHRIQQPAAIRAQLRRPHLSHVLHIEEGHGPLALTGRRKGDDARGADYGARTPMAKK